MLRILFDSPIHKWLSALLAFIFIFAIVLAIPAVADDVVPSPSPSSAPIRPNTPVGWKDGDTFRDIMLVVLDSWGISFSKSDGSDLDILEYADILMQEFYDDSQTTQELFWDLVKYGVNETGEIILDFLGVNKIRQIANWIKDKFSLEDNDVVDTSVPSGYYLADGTPIIFSVGNRDSYCTIFQIGQLYTTIEGVQFMYAADGSYYTYYKNQVQVARYSTYAGQTDWNFKYRGTNNDLCALVIGGFSDLGPFTFDQVLGPSTPGQPGITINTTVINIPSQDLPPDDGLKISIPGTNWGDSIFTILDLIERLIGLYDNTQLEIVSIVDTLETLIANLQRSVTVENIPGAVTLDYDQYDIPLESEWGLIDDFYGLEFSDDDTLFTPFDTLKSLIFGLPEPLILFLSVIIVWVVAYGFIRMGRDSH